MPIATDSGTPAAVTHEAGASDVVRPSCPENDPNDRSHSPP